jgi:hypothetical protein
MPSIELPVDGKCPKCGAGIRLARIEPHPIRAEAYQNAGLCWSKCIILPSDLLSANVKFPPQP